MTYNLVPLAVHLSRAFEIAKAGHHAIGLTGITEADGFKPGVDIRDVKLLRDFYGLTLYPDDPAIIVELTPYDAGTVLSVLGDRKSENLEDINKRIDEYQLNGPEVSDTLNSSCKALFKTAIEKLGLSFKDCTQILAVAKTIAGLSGSENILPEHLAEAIQYKSIPLSDYIKNKL